MSDGPNYCWKQGQLYIHPERIHFEDVKKLDCLECPIIDTAVRPSQWEVRYGYFTLAGQGDPGQIKWVPTPFKDFPEEFKLALLLIGVTE